MTLKKPVRRSQLISPFGVGSLVDFPRDESLMPAGLDAWPYARMRCPPEWIVLDERLQRRLSVAEFRLPPEHRAPGPGVQNANLNIPFVRFPQWHYCPRQGLMSKLALFAGREKCTCRQNLRCYTVTPARRPYLIPIRLVAACEDGHVEDFPFAEWVHRGPDPGEGHQLRFIPGRSSAAISGIKIECVCGADRTLGGVFEFDQAKGGALHRIGRDCNGGRPWLGVAPDPMAPCGKFLRVVQRGASNVYFPVTFSSIYLPIVEGDEDPRIGRALLDARVWQALSQGLEQGTVISRERCEVVAQLRGLDPERLRKAAQKKLDGLLDPGPQTETEYRRSEYLAFLGGAGGENTELMVESIPMERYPVGFRRFVSSVTLIRKLRETRAFFGFTRVLPPSGARDDPRIPAISSNPNLNWLPATTVRGEGIFIQLHVNGVAGWGRSTRYSERLTPLLKAYREARLRRGQPPRIFGPAFMVLHTLSHALIRQLSVDCGYGSASLRERLYYDDSTDGEPMLGVLIYTASGDSEGTMGGLVRQGQPGRLENTVARTLRHCSWCGADPVCIESLGQGVESTNLAACHACVLLPETSCEEGNRLLDRACLVGSPSNRGSGFFGPWVQEISP